MRWYFGLGHAVVIATASLLVISLPADAQPKPADSAAAPAAAATDAGTGPSLSVRNASKGLVVPPALADVEEMCALLTSCENIAFPRLSEDLPSCVTQLWDLLSGPEAIRTSLGIRECALKANSCNDLRECALAGASADACRGRAMTSEKPIGFCDLDGRAISCWRGQPQFVRDCPRGGEQCSVIAGKPICSLGPCPDTIKEGESTCSPDGRRVLTCAEGRVQSRDCTVLGLTCDTPGGKPACVPSTKTCSTKDHRCDGNSAVSCLDGHEVRVACGVANSTCAVTKDDNSVGLCNVESLSTARCEDSHRARCAGATIEYCAKGHLRKFMCKAFGFENCAMGRAGPRCTR